MCQRSRFKGSELGEECGCVKMQEAENSSVWGEGWVWAHEGWVWAHEGQAWASVGTWRVSLGTWRWVWVCGGWVWACRGRMWARDWSQLEDEAIGLRDIQGIGHSVHTDGHISFVKVDIGWQAGYWSKQCRWESAWRIKELACGFLHSNSGVWGLFLRDVIRSFRWTIFLEDVESNQGKPFLAYNGFSLTLHKKMERIGSNSLCFTRNNNEKGAYWSFKAKFGLFSFHLRVISESH